MTAGEIIALLGLVPHPEGGFYREMFRDEKGSGGRSYSTSIYFLLQAGQVSSWHRVDSAEVWHWYAGGPLELSIAYQPGILRPTLGPDLMAGERPQLVVPARHWQHARPLGAYTLAGCTVAPGFEFAGFEIAPSGSIPGGSHEPG